MSGSRRKYIRKAFFLTQDQVVFIEMEAKHRDPRRYNSPGATRAQSGVARDLVDFARKHYPLFLTFVATNSQKAIGDNTEQPTTPGA